MNRSDHSSAPRLAEGLGRRQFLRGIAATGAMAGAGSLLAACGGSSSSSTKSLAQASRPLRRGGDLKLGLTGGSSSDTVDPHKSLTYIDTSRLQSLYQPLVQLNGQAQVEYVLAESITAYRGSLSQWVIRLRPGVTFHNGKDFTADDVLFTFQRISSNDFTGKFGLGPIDLNGTKALDKLTVLVQMTKPFSSFAEQLAAFWYNRLVPGLSFIRASRPASAACSRATLITGSPGFRTWILSPSSTSVTTPPFRTRWPPALSTVRARLTGRRSRHWAPPAASRRSSRSPARSSHSRCVSISRRSTTSMFARRCGSWLTARS
jgi:hypothetical protein